MSLYGRYRSSAEEAQRRLVVGAAAVEQAMQEAHAMRARATQAEHFVEELKPNPNPNPNPNRRQSMLWTN